VRLRPGGAVLAHDEALEEQNRRAKASQPSARMDHDQLHQHLSSFRAEDERLASLIDLLDDGDREGRPAAHASSPSTANERTTTLWALVRDLRSQVEAGRVLESVPLLHNTTAQAQVLAAYGKGVERLAAVVRQDVLRVEAPDARRRRLDMPKETDGKRKERKIDRKRPWRWRRSSIKQAQRRRVLASWRASSERNATPARRRLPSLQNARRRARPRPPHARATPRGAPKYRVDGAGPCGASSGTKK
jgi:hypothetical protein